MDCLHVSDSCADGILMSCMTSCMTSSYGLSMSDVSGLQMVTNKLPLLSLWQRNLEIMRTGSIRLYCPSPHTLDFKNSNVSRIKTSGANHLHTKSFAKLAVTACSFHFALAQSCSLIDCHTFYHKETDSGIRMSHDIDTAL